MIRRLTCFALLVLAGCSTPPGPQGLVAVRHGDFDHNTLALTWQPGFCSAGKGCATDQPRVPLIGLHGLWASEPHSLETQNVPVEHWWRDGCSLLPGASAPLVLDTPMQATLNAVVPHVTPPLVPHEYSKHAACFGYAPGPFFAQAVALRLRFARSPVAEFLAARAGTRVTHDEIMGFFRKATGALSQGALQLRCETDRTHRVVLTQLWFTLKPDAMKLFPASGAYLPSPQNQDNCPAQFWLMRW